MHLKKHIVTSSLFYTIFKIIFISRKINIRTIYCNKMKPFIRFGKRDFFIKRYGKNQQLVFFAVV